MRIETLRVYGIIPFYKPVEVHFHSLQNLISISGPNGVGKSTLLESVTGALYNIWPSRMCGKDAKTIYDVVVPGVKAYVEMIFTVRGVKYRIIRNYAYGITWSGKEQKKASGDQTAFIYEWIGIGVNPEQAPDGWLPKAQAVRNVDDYVQQNIITRELFFASAFSAQESEGDLFDAPVSERKQIFANLLNLQHLQAKSELFNIRGGKVAKMIENLQGDIRVHESHIVDVEAVGNDITGNQDHLTVLNGLIKHLEESREMIVSEMAQVQTVSNQIADKKNAIRKLETKKYDLEKDKQERELLIGSEKSLRGRMEQIDGWKVELEKCDKALAGKDSIQKQIEPLQAELNYVEQQKRKLAEAYSFAINDINKRLYQAEKNRDFQINMRDDYKRKEKAASILSGLDCAQNCSYVSDAVQAKKEIDKIDYVFIVGNIDKYKNEMAACAPEQEKVVTRRDTMKNVFTYWVNEIQRQIDALKVKLRGYEEVESSKRRLLGQIKDVESGNIAEKLALMDEHKKRVAEITAEIKEIDEQIKGLHVELSNLETKESVKKDYEMSLQRNGIERDRLNKDKNETVGRIANLEKALNDSATAEMKRDIVQSRIDSLTKLGALYYQLEEAFGLKGIQALVIDAEQSQFLNIARELFDILSGGDMALQFDTQRMNKDNKTIREDFTLSLIIKGVKVDLKCCSKGQKDLGRMIMRATLGIYNGIKNSGVMETLFLDETTGSFDEIKRENYFNFLKYLTKYFAQIVVISHQDIAQIIPCRIQITEDRRLEITA